MKQIATVLRKDFERLWPACLIVIALIGFHLYAVIFLGPSTSVLISGPLSLLFLIASLSGILLPFAMVAAVAFVIQEESLVGSNAFWLTRPYSRTALLVEKALFIACAVFLPMIAHDLLAVRWFGMASHRAITVILTEHLELAGVLVCAAGFAVLTAGFARFTLLVLGGAIAFGLMVMATNDVDARNWGLLSGVSGVLAWSIVVVGATIVILHQYRTRRAIRSAVVGAVSLILAALALSYFPYTAAWNIKNWFGIPTASLAEVQLIPTPDASDTILAYDPASAAQSSSFQQILYPFRISNLPGDVSLQAFRCRTEIKSASAVPPLVVSPNTLFRHRPPLSAGLSAISEKQFVSIGVLPEQTLARLQDTGLTLEGTIYFEAYRDLQPIHVPLSTRDGQISIDREHCAFRTVRGVDQNAEETVTAVLNCAELEPGSGIEIDAVLVDAAGKSIWSHSSGFSGTPGNRELLPVLLNPIHQSILQFEFGHQTGVDPPSLPEDSSVVISARKPDRLVAS